MDALPPTSFYPILELLMRHDVSPKIAQYVAMNELRHWPLDRLSQIFDSVKRSTRGYCPFKHASEFMNPDHTKDLSEARQRERAPRSVINASNNKATLNDYLRSCWPSVFDKTERWLLPPRDLMVQAAKQGLALCINDKGYYALRAADYIAVSHAWIEGLQRDRKPDGVPKSKIDLIFWSLRRQLIQTEWVWVDVLAIPGSATETTPVEDELLKINLINTLADVYTRADGIAVFDALTWQLTSNDPISVCATLVCGAWASRVWTFQEIKLAKKAFIITSGPTGMPAPEWSDIIDCLASAQVDNHNMYHNLWLFSVVLHGKKRLSIRDLVGRCQIRETGNDIDYARAFFPTLGLKWTPGMTREEGMQQIYYSQLWEASRTMFFFGCPRMSVRPGWMPSTLVGLAGELCEGFENEDRGIKGEVDIVEVHHIKKRFRRKGRWVLECLIPDIVVQCVLHESEDPNTLDDIGLSVTQGCLYLMRPALKGHDSPREYAKTGLFARKASVDDEHAFECTVLCAVLITFGDTSSMLQQQKVLIRHGVYRDAAGVPDFFNILKYGQFSREEESVPQGEDLRTGEQAIHRAVRNNNLERVQAIVESGASPHDFDGTSLSALHIACSRGYDKILEYLLSLPEIDLNLPSGTNDHDTPLFSAASNNHPTCIRLLIQAGVNPDHRRSDGYTALMMASYKGNLEAVWTLLQLGANVNMNGFGTIRETPLKLACSINHPAAQRLLLVGSLLKAGANPNGILQLSDVDKQDSTATTSSDGKQPSPYIWPAISVAVEWCNDDIVTLLLAAGANPNIPGAHLGFSPVLIAVKTQRRRVLILLIATGAKCDFELDGGWNLLHHAAKCSDFEITRVILATLDSQTKRRLIEAKLEENNMTPIDLARAAGHRIVEKLLIKSYEEAKNS